MARNAWRGCEDGYDHEALAERPKRKSEGAAHRCAAPFPGPAAPGMAGHVPLSGLSRSDSGGSVASGALRRVGWSPAVSGAGIGVFACGIVGMGSAGGLSSYTRIIRLSDVHGRRRDASPSLLFACRINGCHCFPGGLSRPPGSLDRKRGSWFSRVSRWRPVDACLV